MTVDAGGPPLTGPLDEHSFNELAELLSIRSVSADPDCADEVRRAGQWIARFVCDRLAGTADVLEDGRLVVGEVRASRGAEQAPTVLIYGHYDVQPPGPRELWESDPFKAEIRDGWLYARGACDNKGQLWMQLKAAQRLSCQGELPVNLRVVCDGEEESGGSALTRFLATDRRGADAAVIFDGWMKQPGVPEFTLSARGLVALDLQLRTGERDLHSGHYGGTAMNAIHALTQALSALYPHQGRLPEPLRQGVDHGLAHASPPSSDLPPGAAELTRVGAVPLDARAAAEFYERTWFEPSVDVTGILAGKPGQRNTTVVSRAAAEVTIRVAPGQDPESIADAAERLVREAAPAGAAMAIRRGETTPPATIPADTTALQLASQAFERVFGRRPLLSRAGGTLPILAALVARGIPTVETGLGSPECNTHSPNERLPLETLPLGIAAASETYRAFARLKTADGQAAN